MAEHLPMTSKQPDVVSLKNTDLKGDNLELYKFILAQQPDVIKEQLVIADLTQHFRDVKRGPRYYDNQPESDVEHSFMVALSAMELAFRANRDEGTNLDIFKAGAYGLVHDIIEVKTGDIVTFNISDADRAAKEAAEQAALEELLNELPPFLAMLVENYEKQEDDESRFVRMTDKLMPPIVDIVGQGTRLVYEQYDATTLGALVESHEKSLQNYTLRFSEYSFLQKLYAHFAWLYETKYVIELPAAERRNRWPQLKKRMIALGKAALNKLQ
jgi:5'-deoxynucleotidase YfbR-like HD superfamily hydrolase